MWSLSCRTLLGVRSAVGIDLFPMAARIFEFRGDGQGFRQPLTG